MYAILVLKIEVAFNKERQNKILTTLQSRVLLTLNHKHCNHWHTCMKWVF